MTDNSNSIGRAEIADVYDKIRVHIRRTPILDLAGHDFGLGHFPLYLKLELLQHTGSFKVRGAVANLLLRKVPTTGIGAASGGNHGVAVAFAAHAFHIPARIFVPQVCSPAKQRLIRSYGAELLVTGARYSESLAACDEW